MCDTHVIQKLHLADKEPVKREKYLEFDKTSFNLQFWWVHTHCHLPWPLHIRPYRGTMGPILGVKSFQFYSFPVVYRIDN